MKIGIVTKPEDGVPEHLKRIMARSKDLAPALQKFSAHMKGPVAMAFEQRGYPANTWPPSSKGFYSGDPSAKTLLETGRLRASILSSFKVEKNVFSYGTSVKGARLLFEGGTVTPKTARALAIPLTKAARRKKPRDWKDTFIWRGFIWQKAKRVRGQYAPGAKIIPLYKLMRRVVLPRRNYPRPLKPDYVYFERVLGGRLEVDDVQPGND